MEVNSEDVGTVSLGDVLEPPGPRLETKRAELRAGVRRAVGQDGVCPVGEVWVVH
jgi:hypothetical protein